MELHGTKRKKSNNRLKITRTDEQTEGDSECKKLDLAENCKRKKAFLQKKIIDQKCTQKPEKSPNY